MVGIPIAFTLVRKNILPIVTVTGVSKPIPGIERFMLSKAVEMIEIAEKFNGRVMESNGNEDMNDVPKGMVAVRFYLIFKDETELEKGLSGMRRELG